MRIFVMIFLAMILPISAKAEFITSVDIMKYTKDNLQSQFTNDRINAVVDLIMKEIKPKYIAISVPLDDTTGYAQRWADSIHAAGANVIFRGTWFGMEGIYGSLKLVGNNRILPDVWLDKTRQYIISNPDLFSDNDIWAILPERTEGIFQEQTSFLSHEDGIQQNYVNFYEDLDTVSTAAFAEIGKAVKVGYTANNFSEIASGWMPVSMYENKPVIAVDHYGISHTAAEMESDLTKAYQRYGKPIFLQEWGDYWNDKLPPAIRVSYLRSMYEMFEKLAHEKILIGFNYWGGWANELEGVLTYNEGEYGLDYRGQMIGEFFTKANTQGQVQSATLAIAENPTAENHTQQPSRMLDLVVYLLSGILAGGFAILTFKSK